MYAFISLKIGGPYKFIKNSCTLCYSHWAEQCPTLPVKDVASCVEGRTPKQQNYLLEGGTLLVQLPLWCEWGTHLYQRTSWHCFGKLCSASVHFFYDSFNVFAHFMRGDFWAHLLTTHWVFSSFWPKMAWPLYSPPCSPDLAPSNFFLFP